jgi:hypothetical protein
MRRTISLVLIVSLLLTTVGCAQRRVIEGVKYDYYGLLNQDARKNPDIQYEVVWGNVVLGVIFFETAIAPIYFFGFALFEPVGRKPAIKGQVSEAPGAAHAPLGGAASSD